MKIIQQLIVTQNKFWAWVGAMAFLACLLSVSLAEAKSYSTEEEAATAIVRKLADELTITPLNVEIKKLTLEGSKISSEFADQFLTMVQTAMVQHRQDFKKVKRLRVSTRSLSSIGSFSPGKVTNSFLEGQYRLIDDKVFVYLRLITRNGEKIADAEIALLSSAIKAALKPENFISVQQTERDLVSSVESSPNDFNIRLEINKGDGGTYKAGEELKIFFKSDKDCYVKVIYLDAEGNRVVLYPTEDDPIIKLKKGVVHDLTAHSRWRISCDPTCGTEMLLAVASTEPFRDKNEVDFGGGLKGYGNQKKMSDIIVGLRAVKRIGKTSETRVYLTTVSK